MQDLPGPPPEPPQESGAPIDLTGEIRPWWQRSPPLAAGAALAIGLATLWFGNMLGRVPLDAQSSFAYLLMLPLLLIVPAFSAAAMRLAWLALRKRTLGSWIIPVLALAALAANTLAVARLGSALWRIFTH